MAQAIAELNLKSGKFLSELIWREFYYHIIWRHPQNGERPLPAPF